MKYLKKKTKRRPFMHKYKGRIYSKEDIIWIDKKSYTETPLTESKKEMTYGEEISKYMKKGS